MRSLRADPLAAVGRDLAEHGDAVGIKGGPIEVVGVARPVAPAFARARVEALVPHLVAGADELVLRWTRLHGNGASFDASPDLSRAALDIVCRAIFGSDVREHADTFHRHATVAASYAQYLFDHVFPVPRWIPTERNRRIKQALAWVRGFLHGMIEQHRRLDPLPDDLLGLLLATRDEPREALAQDEIDGVRIPKGATVMIAVHYLHRHPEFYREPERFDPERWLEERGGPKHAFAYLPFGLGGRRCVGEDFALLELRAVLARLLQHFCIETDPTHAVVARPQLTLEPANGERLRLAPRIRP
jgi:cytochrome P450